MNEYEKSDIEKEVIDTFKAFMRAYFTKRDLDSSLRFLSPEFTAIGTGKDERVFTMDNLITLYKRDFRQIPNPVDYEFYYIKPALITDMISVLVAEYKITGIVNNIPFELNNLRVSIIFKKIENNWLILHSHLSLPFVIQKKGEAYPLETLKERNTLLGKLVETKTNELNIAMRELEKLATTDKLTNIYNRYKFEEFLTYEMERVNRYNEKFSLLMFDVDFFKDINDTYGHLTGDRVLKEIATITKTSIRKIDIFARWGGDEFVILFPSTNLDSARMIAEKLRKAIFSHNYGIEKRVSVSIGVTQYLKKESIESVIKRVDNLLYIAKNNGRNIVKN